MNTPISANERIVSLDILRGIAVMGILLMNIQSFSMPGAAYLNPTAYGNLEGANYSVWMFSHLFAEQKFMAIFSMLFGAGILMFANRLEQKNLRATGIHYRRMFWLLVFGMIHGYLIWYGDILYIYAMCGFLVFLLRNKSVTTLLVIAVILLLIPFLIYMLAGVSLQFMPASEAAEIKKSWLPSEQLINEEVAAYTGSWLEALAHRAPTTLMFQTFLSLIWGFWRAAGMMLIGMALYKKGFFTLQFTNKTYIGTSVLCLIIGFSFTGYGMWQNILHQFAFEYSMFLGSQFNYVGSIFVALGYSSLVMLAIKLDLFSRLQSRLAMMGKMAFTHYIIQSLICTTLFYHFGFFGEFSRVEQILLVFAIWTVQFMLTPLWLSRYAYGPLEWAWRSLTYWNIRAIKRSSQMPIT